MKTGDKFERFSSCRGVAFEIKPRNDPFSVPKPQNIEANSHSSKRSWLPWETFSTKIVPSSSFMQRSMSRTSSHFCDLDIDEDEDDVTLADIEKGYYEKEGSPLQIPQVGSSPLPFLPPKSLSKCENQKSSKSRLSIILLDQGLFTVYKRLFVLSLILNITFLILASTGNFPYARKKAVLFSIGNIFALTLCRSEAFLRVVFWLAVNCLGWSWIPIRIKTIVTSLLQSLGGIHSGCAISSIAWLVYALILTLKDRENTSPEIICVAFAILSLLSLSSFTAFPLVRHLHHNFFERIHRFFGWIALALLWIFITLTISYDHETKSYNTKIGPKLIKQQEFWFTLAITVLIIIPWITVRCVPVEITSPSGHASIIKFEGGIKAGILGRISPSPFSEWHAFGIISDGKKEHMMLAGAVGDFTKSLVVNPPSHLWVRQVHFAGLPYLVNMYNRVLVVATGSGICVFLSFLLQPCSANVCLLWVTKGVEQNFGKEIKEMISGHPKEKVIIHDTALLGRPNVSEMSVEAARKWGAEVVIVTSNPEGSRDVVNACKKSGIPAFGPIWDS
ncbi:adenylate-forming reductase 06235-like [Lycium ferocissimum]|uniref:adenylate-forming reductase 06235-like n=1 Tax=Lycium ferocissimum TaxID=112874 RepID=UPI002816152C|nr:adenylate-forming reductase 06235-like [Lycium ferocissimum]